MLRNLNSALVICLLASCTTMDKEQTSSSSADAIGLEPTPVTSGPAVDASAELSTSAADLAQSTVNESSAREPIIYRGNNQLVKMPPVEGPVRLIGEDVSLNFEQAPLTEVMHAILGDILNLDYIVDQPVKGQVTLRTRTPIPRDQLLGVLESLLKSNNALMIKGSDGRYLITGSTMGGRLSPGVAHPNSGAVGFSTIVVPLRYVSASGMAEILTPVADESSIVLVDDTRNILMLAGTREQLDGWLELVGTFDVDLLKGMSVGLFPLENSEVDEVALGLDALLDGGASEGGSGPLSKLVRVIPVDRLNSIMIVTPRSEYLDIMGNWITRMDAAQDSRFEKKLYVYPVQNTSAARLADLLNSIYADTSTSSSGSASRRQYDDGGSGIAPGMDIERLGNTGGGAGSASFDVPGSTGEGVDISSVSMSSDIDSSNSPLQGVRVVADDDNNALMIYSNGKQYDIIVAALEQLDIVATQVIIEASILEVSLTDELRYGLEWTFSNSIGNDREGTGLLTNNDSGGPALQIPGFSYVVTNTIGDVKAVLNALAEESLINVISTPSVMVLDNHTAYIHVGDQVPIIDQQSTSDASDTSRITQSITYRDTGVKLSVTPSVNAGGLVTMDVEQSVTDVGPIDAATGSGRSWSAIS